MLNFNDDIDDLIRQAADEYPLKTSGSDWDKVAGAIHGAAQTPPTNGRNYWWLLFLLLPLMIAVPVYYHRNGVQQQRASSQTKTADAATQHQDLNTITENAGKEPKQITESNALTTPMKKAGSKVGNNELTDQHDFAAKSRNNSNNTSAMISSSKNADDRVSSNATAMDNNKVVPGTNDGRDNSDKTFTENNHSQAAKSGLNISDGEKKEENGSNNTYPKADSSKTNTTVPASQKENVAITSKANSNVHTTPVKRKGLYAGLGAGLDITAVKFNKVEKAGYSASLIVGYRINNHWSVESGLMWDNKKYYSPGQYFDKSRTSIPENYYIHYLNGVCRMYEIPLNVKYDFKSKKLSGFFVSAGLSSYLMKKESYEYHATYNGTYYKGSWDYKNSTNNILSVANINGGYQFIFKNNHSLRVEPYLKIPLTGLGIGKLPFGSTGITAAYTLPLH